jgi:hypothetical protein
MKIIVLSRLSREKNIPRLLLFAKLLPDGYSIDLYGSGDTSLLDNHDTCINYLGPVPDAAKLIRSYDYLALLSDTEGYPYAVVEALSRQVPVLVTPFEEARNLVTDRVNGYIVPFDVTKFDFKKLSELPKPPPFEPKSSALTWIEYFTKHLNRTIMKRRIRIIGENITFAIGEVVEISQKRADKAVRIGIAEYVGPDVPVTTQDQEETEFVPVENANPATPSEPSSDASPDTIDVIAEVVTEGSSVEPAAEQEPDGKDGSVEPPMEAVAPAEKKKAAKTTK